jgi:hypothetical protein
MIDLDETGPDMRAEAPPPLGIFTSPQVMPPEGEAPDYDQWGNIKTDPIKVVEETHGKNFIKIFIYTAPGGNAWFFGFQLKIEKVVRQKLANIADPPLRGRDAAQLAARNMIINICKKNHAIKKIFADFTVIRYNQLELF